MNKITPDKPFLTPEDFAELIHMFRCNNKNPSSREYDSTDYLFRCETCTNINGDDEWYKLNIVNIDGYREMNIHQLIIDIIYAVRMEPLISRNHKEGYNSLNLSKILKNDKTDYQSSGLNYVNKDGFKGYVCDHCKDTIFEDEE